jgi:membrane protease YdiL (CAAX protease family)
MTVERLLDTEEPSGQFEKKLADVPLSSIAWLGARAFLALLLLHALSSNRVFGRLSDALVSCSAMFFWVLRVTPHRGYRLRELLGEPPRASDWVTLLGVVASNLGFQVALVELGRVTGFSLVAPTPWTVASSGVGAIIDVANLVVVGTVLGPVLEELVFRGVLFRKWRRTLGPVKGLLLSSAVFGLIHGGTMLPVAVGGLSLALLYTSTRSLWAPILAHIFNNSISVAAFLVSLSRGGRGSELNLTPARVVVLLLASSAVLLAFAWRSASTLCTPLPPFRAAPLLASPETQAESKLSST